MRIVTVLVFSFTLLASSAPLDKDPDIIQDPDTVFDDALPEDEEFEEFNDEPKDDQVDENDDEDEEEDNNDDDDYLHSLKDQEEEEEMDKTPSQSRAEKVYANELENNRVFIENRKKDKNNKVGSKRDILDDSSKIQKGPKQVSKKDGMTKLKENYKTLRTVNTEKEKKDKETSISSRDKAIGDEDDDDGNMNDDDEYMNGEDEGIQEEDEPIFMEKSGHDFSDDPIDEEPSDDLEEN